MKYIIDITLGTTVEAYIDENDEVVISSITDYVPGDLSSSLQEQWKLINCFNGSEEKLKEIIRKKIRHKQSVAQEQSEAKAELENAKKLEQSSTRLKRLNVKYLKTSSKLQRKGMYILGVFMPYSEYKLKSLREKIKRIAKEIESQYNTQPKLLLLKKAYPGYDVESKIPSTLKNIIAADYANGKTHSIQNIHAKKRYIRTMHVIRLGRR